MTIDFGALPPEVNSQRMYSGPGAAPMLAAASAWSGLAAELRSTATDFHNVLITLHNEEWIGPASTLMADAVAPYEAWLVSTTAQAEHAASQARSAAAAYQSAFAQTVPPPLIATNRSQLASLVQTNILGQNTAAIAAKEAEYGQMWAQDAAAMYTYAGSSATASALTPFTSPPQIANPAATQIQAAATTQAAASTAGKAQSMLSRVISEVPKALSSLSSPVRAALTAGGSTPSPIEKFFAWFTPLTGALYSTVGLPYFGLGMMNSAVTSATALALAAPTASAAVAADGALGDLGALLGGGPVSAGMANAASAGGLSVPPTWTAANPVPSAANALTRVSDVVEPPEVGGPGNLLGGMPLAGTGSGASGAGPRYGFRPTVMARPPFAG